MAFDMYRDSEAELSNQEKAAILFIALGPGIQQSCSGILTMMKLKITLEIANHKQVSAEQKSQVVNEFYQMAMAKDYISTGGLEYAQSVLEKALGADRGDGYHQSSGDEPAGTSV